MYIDERVKHVGISMLRKLNSAALRKLNFHIFVLQDGNEPLAVLVPYKLYLEIQDKALKGEEPKP